MKKENIHIILAVCFIFVLVFFILFLLPKYQEFQALSTQQNNQQAVLENKEAYFAKIKQLSSRLENYQSELAKIDLALPDEISLPNLFNFFQGITARSGLILQDIGLVSLGAKPAEGTADINQSRFNLTVSGSYSSFKTLLSLLESSARLIEVENISFNSPSEEAIFSFNLTIRVHSH